MTSYSEGSLVSWNGGVKGSKEGKERVLLSIRIPLSKRVPLNRRIVF
jgi:hypothetical protein